MYITLPDGRQLGGGGMGGKALPDGRMMNCSVHQSDDEVRYMVGRVHTAIRRLRLTFTGAPPSLVDLEPFGESPDLGVAFVAAILDDDSSLADITAWDAQGRCVDRQSARFYGSFFEGGGAVPGADVLHPDGISGWKPA